VYDGGEVGGEGSERKADKTDEKADSTTRWPINAGKSNTIPYVFPRTDWSWGVRLTSEWFMAVREER